MTKRAVNHAVVTALDEWAAKVAEESGGQVEVSVDKAIIGKPAYRVTCYPIR